MYSPTTSHLYRLKAPPKAENAPTATVTALRLSVLLRALLTVLTVIIRFSPVKDAKFNRTQPDLWFAAILHLHTFPVLSRFGGYVVTASCSAVVAPKVASCSIVKQKQHNFFFFFFVLNYMHSIIIITHQSTFECLKNL